MLRSLLQRFSPALILLLLCIWGIPIRAGAQAADSREAATGYSNRIEYHSFNWEVFHGSNFHLYFPKGADSLPAAIAEEVAPAKEQVAKRMSTTMSSVPAIIIYPSLTAQYESSIGRLEKETLTFPTFISRGNRIVLHYNGSYEELRAQLHLAFARAIWERELGQQGIAAQVSGAVSQSKVPYWFREGAISWFGRGWPLGEEETLRGVYYADSPASFGGLATNYPSLAGSALCYYLSTVIRQDAPTQLFHLLRKGKPLEKALRLVTKRPADSVYASCYRWYKQRFASAASPQQLESASKEMDEGSRENSPSGGNGGYHIFSVPLPPECIVITALLSPDGKKLALSAGMPGDRRQVYLYDLEQHSRTRCAHYALPPWFRNHQADRYPLLSWGDNSSELLVTYPQKGIITVSHISTGGKETAKTQLPFIDGLSGLIPLADNRYLLSAWRQGQSDLVVYDATKERYEPITSDASDDASPTLWHEEAGSKSKLKTRIGTEDLYFSSARKGDPAFGQDSTKEYHGVYRLRGKMVTPVLTDTLSYITYTDPVVIDGQHLLLTTTRGGKRRMALHSLQSSVRAPKPGSAANSSGSNPAAIRYIGDAATPFQYLHSAGTIAFFKPQNDSLTITIVTAPLDDWIKKGQTGVAGDTFSAPWLQDYNSRAAAKRKEDSILRAAKAAGGSSFLEGVFAAKNNQEQQEAKKQKESAKRDSKGKASVLASGSDSASIGKFSARKAVPYVLQLYSAYFSAQVNNDYFINRYQPYGAFQGTFKFPEVGGMVSGGLSDLFEHHHLNIAYRLPAGSEGSMFFTKYSNTAKRLDWSLAYYRDVESIRPDPQRVWVDESGRPYPNAAKVKTHYYELGLSYPLSYYSAIGGALSFRKDRTVFLATDAYSLSFPALTDLWAHASIWEQTVHLRPTVAGLFRGWQGRVDCDAFKGLSRTESALAALSIMAEWDKLVYRYITFVVKGQAGFSAGDKKVLYNLGGVDNNLTPRVDSTVHFSQSGPYAFQTLVTPFRGYLQNSLYGSKYALVNMDLYFPLFQTLIPVETAFPSINNMRLGLFSDIGCAGGESVYASSGKGWRWSYGVSAGSVFAGYPVRFDLAWPGSFSNRPVWYLSLNLR